MGMICVIGYEFVAKVKDMNMIMFLMLMINDFNCFNCIDLFIKKFEIWQMLEKIIEHNIGL